MAASAAPAWVPRPLAWFARLGAGSLVVYLFHGFFVKGAEYAGWKPLGLGAGAVSHRGRPQSLRCSWPSPCPGGRCASRCRRSSRRSSERRRDGVARQRLRQARLGHRRLLLPRGDGGARSVASLGPAAGRDGAAAPSRSPLQLPHRAAGYPVVRRCRAPRGEAGRPRCPPGRSSAAQGGPRRSGAAGRPRPRRAAGRRRSRGQRHRTGHQGARRERPAPPCLGEHPHRLAAPEGLTGGE